MSGMSPADMDAMEYMTAVELLALIESRAENAKLREALKGLMVGTYAELCADRGEPQCSGCLMRHDGGECAVTDAMDLLGCDMYGKPTEIEEDE